MELVGCRAQVAFVKEKFQMSERRACGLIGMDRSSCRYRARSKKDEDLKQALKDLARKRPRFGYRRLTALLEREGRKVNHKRVWRLCKTEGLWVRWKKRRRLIRTAPGTGGATRPNEEWAMDFVSDWAGSGQKLRALTIVDLFSRLCPEMEVATSIGSRRVTRALERAGEKHGYPTRIRTDNGPEFRSRHFHAWCEQRGIEVVHTQPGKPTQNGHNESFNGRFRDECLNANWFQNVEDARRTITAWKEDYNQFRPHSALAYRSPAEFAAQFEASAKAASGIVATPNSVSAVLASASNCGITTAEGN